MLTEEQLTAIRNRAGCHSIGEVPKDEEQRLYFGLLEIIDFQCCVYGDAPEGVTEEDVKAYLIEHKDKIKCEPPSFLGMLTGAFNFLWEDKYGTD